MPETTQLDDLPIAPTTETDTNIKLETTEKNIKIDSAINNLRNQRETELTSNQNGQIGSFGSNDVKEFVEGVQEAVSAGALGLQARDIPQSQEHLTQDPQMKPSFIPTRETTDYIGFQQSSQEIINNNTNKKRNDDNLDIIYTKLQTPLLLALLYFLFQMPIVKQTALRLIPSMFHKDGNPNLTGYITNSVVFAGTYYVLMLTLQYFSI